MAAAHDWREPHWQVKRRPFAPSVRTGIAPSLLANSIDRVFSRLMLTNVTLSPDTLVKMLQQSTDCVKFISLDGTLEWMNDNGMCAMEIDDFSSVAGRPWCELWPETLSDRITQSLDAAAAGDAIRFTAPCPTAKGTPRWWDISVALVHLPDGGPAGYLSISRDVTAAETSRMALELANREMVHRLSNTYSIVGGLLLGFARGNPERESFAREMQKRLHALYRAQTLFLDSDKPRSIAELLAALTEPFAGTSRSIRLDVSSTAPVDRGVSDAIALALGELTVNSIKHGALGTGGSLGLSARDSDGRVRIMWQERSDRPVAARSRTGGQGLGLIEQIIGARGGTLDLEWMANGLDATLTVPVSSETAAG